MNSSINDAVHLPLLSKLKVVSPIGPSSKHKLPRAHSKIKAVYENNPVGSQKFITERERSNILTSVPVR